MSSLSPAAVPLPASLAGDVRAAAGDIKLSHSVFALPFALLGAFLAHERGSPWSGFWFPLALVVACMVLARTWAMLINRLADARFDARNPRTARRAIPAGRLAPGRAAILAGLSAGTFLLVCLGFLVLAGNPWPVLLGAPVLAWLAFYSFAKRFTWACHLLLGSALACSPIAAAIAVRPASIAHAPALFWLFAMVTLWVGGFDVIYALQDVEFDRAEGLRSIPARFGAERAVLISRAMHAGAFACLAIAAFSDARFGALFRAGVALVGLLLIVEHIHLARRGRAGIEMAFFTINGVVSCIAGGLGIADLIG